MAVYHRGDRVEIIPGLAVPGLSWPNRYLVQEAIILGGPIMLCGGHYYTIQVDQMEPYPLCETRLWPETAIGVIFGEGIIKNMSRPSYIVVGECPNCGLDDMIFYGDRSGDRDYICAWCRELLED